VLTVVAGNKDLARSPLKDKFAPSPGAVEELHRLGMRVAMITGDSKAVAESVHGVWDR